MVIKVLKTFLYMGKITNLFGNSCDINSRWLLCLAKLSKDKWLAVPYDTFHLWKWNKLSFDNWKINKLSIATKHLMLSYRWLLSLFLTCVLNLWWFKCAGYGQSESHILKLSSIFHFISENILVFCPKDWNFFSTLRYSE